MKIFEDDTQYMGVIAELLTDVSEFLLKEIGNNSIQVYKGARDYALNTDIAVESKCKSFLREHFKDIPILGEELSPTAFDKDYDGIFWAIDPIDGTINYARGLPEYGVSIALVERKRAIASGLIFPALGEQYVAASGYGAFMNGNKIIVSSVDNYSEAIVCFGDFSVGDKHEEHNKKKIAILDRIANEVLRVRMPGTAALQLAWVASGRADISLTLSNNAWDVQGGVLIVREAGGNVFDFDRTTHTISSKYTFATNGLLDEYVINVVG